MRTWLALPILFACSDRASVLAPAEDDPGLDSLPTAGALPPPGELTLEVDNVIAGAPTAIHVTGADPGALLYFVYSRAGIGEGRCPAPLGGACLGVLDPAARIQLGVYADPDGTFDGVFVAPRGWAGSYVGLQVVVLGAAMSNAVGRPVAGVGTILDPDVDYDGDGYTPAQGDCGDTDPTIAPLEDDVAGDGIDQNCDDFDGCVEPCGTSICGNDVVEAPETCEDSNDVDTDACVSCTLATCGDMYVRAGVEGCDDGNADPTDACVDCEVATCGDGHLRAGVELCDDGNLTLTDACPQCAPATCGDGWVRSGVEVCDDANSSNTDACVACQTATCGDGYVRSGVEECDDGNIVSGDGCQANCTIPVATDCKAIKAANSGAADGTYTIDPDGSGPVAPFPVWCEMQTQGGGWTLVMTRQNAQSTSLTTSQVTPSTPRVGITDQRWMALRAVSTQLLALADANELVASISTLQGANCVPLASSLAQNTIAHDENSGCTASGSDYSCWFGYGNNIAGATYFSVQSSRTFYSGVSSLYANSASMWIR